MMVMAPCRQGAGKEKHLIGVVQTANAAHADFTTNVQVKPPVWPCYDAAAVT